MKSELKTYQAFVAAQVPEDKAAAAATAIGDDMTAFLENKMQSYATKDDIAKLVEAMHAQTWRIIGALIALLGVAVAVLKLL